MKSFVGALVFVGGVLLCAAPAFADPPDIDLHLGTLGYGAGVTVPVDPHTDYRFEYSYFQYKRSDVYSNLVINVVATLQLDQTYRLNNAAFLIDKYPFVSSPFHITAGALLNENTIHGVSVPLGSSITINGTTYAQSVAGNVIIDAMWNRVAPYFGIGWGGAHQKHRLSVVGDLGVTYQGKVNIALTAPGAIEANESQFQAYFDQEKRQLTSELAPLQLYPVAQVELRYRL